MATTTAQPPTQLPAPLGVNAAYCSSDETTLVMKEKVSFSGDDFSVKTVAGEPIVTCKGQVMSLSGRKEFYTPDGQLLYTLRGKHFSVPKSFYLEGPSGEKFLHIQGRWTFGKAKLDVHFKNVIGDGTDVTLEVRGNFFDRAADITWGGVPVAKIRREFNAKDIFIGKQTYGVMIAPGVDTALIAAIVVALDEDRNEGKKSGGGGG